MFPWLSYISHNSVCQEINGGHTVIFVFLYFWNICSVILTGTLYIFFGGINLWGRQHSDFESHKLT